MSPPSLRSKNKPSKTPRWRIYFLAYYDYLTINWWRNVPPNCRFNLNGLHGVMSQPIKVFITTALRTSYPTFHCFDAVSIMSSNGKWKRSKLSLSKYEVFTTFFHSKSFTSNGNRREVTAMLGHMLPWKRNRLLFRRSFFITEYQITIRSTWTISRNVIPLLGLYCS
jgi:hypothetical protein